MRGPDRYSSSLDQLREFLNAPAANQRLREYRREQLASPPPVLEATGSLAAVS